MNLQEFSSIPQPSRESFSFIQDLKAPLDYTFLKNTEDSISSADGSFRNGITMIFSGNSSQVIPPTALSSLRTVLASRDIREIPDGDPVQFAVDSHLEHEEYELAIQTDSVLLTAADEDGFRRGIYFLEDRICETSDTWPSPGHWRRRPFIRHRISRCFFSPTTNPPFSVDELTDDINYYPEEYLNKLAHEGINGLWLTIHFRDFPSSVLSGQGQDAARRFAKLRLTVQRCRRYGIRIYIFLSEPKYFGDASYAIPFQDAAAHPELIGEKINSFACFCTSQPMARKYLQEAISQIFEAVPQLGGAINIMLGEDNGSCIGQIAANEGSTDTNCPICAGRDFAGHYRELAELFTDAMHRYNPDAEYIGWFYAPRQRDGGIFMKHLLQIAEQWPDKATLMFNFESGGTAWQLNKKRIIFDYSLAYIGPSELFAQASEQVSRMGAKLQVGCSHEDASVPFIPVPGNLYRKYSFMQKHHVSAVMQCWYFGNYPGIMNKAAGELSFLPFPENEHDFLVSLARPCWQENASRIAEAWEFFSEAYRHFPANLCFAWYGPLHNSIVWPLFLRPVDQGIASSWILNGFPGYCGDRIGECIGYHHTLPEIIRLCTTMHDNWQKGLGILKGLEERYRDIPSRMLDICLAKAIGLQISSSLNVLRFYHLREDMLYHHLDHLDEMKNIVIREIENSLAMIDLCRKDCRLGYHSEAEGFLFFPEKLQGRISLLQQLLANDFSHFDLHAAWIDQYTGRSPSGPMAFCRLQDENPAEIYPMGAGTSWSSCRTADMLIITVHNARDRQFTLVLEPCRLWPPFRIEFSENGTWFQEHSLFPVMPDYKVSEDGEDYRIEIPLSLFKDFRHPGFPMKFNIYGEDFHWVDPRPWPRRLMHENYNPHGTGWLIFS